MTDISDIKTPADNSPIDCTTNEQFKMLVEFLAKWVSEEKIFIIFDSNFRPKLFYEGTVLPDLLAANHFSESCAKDLIPGEILFMLLAILQGSRNTAIDYFVDDVTSKPDFKEKQISKEEIETRITERLNYVEKILLTSDLRREYVIKTRAKTNSFIDASWEVVHTIAEDNEKIPTGLTYTLLSLSSVKPGVQPSIYYRPHQEYSEILPVVMTYSDLKFLKQTISEAIKAIDEYREFEKRK